MKITNSPSKVCPVILQKMDDQWFILAFKHPLAGCQIVKGTIEKDETPEAAAYRELYEESGIYLTDGMTPIGKYTMQHTQQDWYFFYRIVVGLPIHWNFDTEDDHGHRFSFFWHSIMEPLNKDWHPMFHEAVGKVLPHLLHVINDL